MRVEEETPRQAADVVEAPVGAPVLDQRGAGPLADAAGGLAARGAREGHLLGGGEGRWCARLCGDQEGLLLVRAPGDCGDPAGAISLSDVLIIQYCMVFVY